jgi:hypothetical protein
MSNDHITPAERTGRAPVNHGDRSAAAVSLLVICILLWLALDDLVLRMMP